MNPVKFDFDTEFDQDGQILREGESYKRFFTQDDVDAARMWGVEEGREMEEGRCAQSLQAIASQMQLILARLSHESDALRQEAAGLAMAAARKIAGEGLAVVRLLGVVVETIPAELDAGAGFRGEGATQEGGQDVVFAVELHIVAKAHIIGAAAHHATGDVGHVVRLPGTDEALGELVIAGAVGQADTAADGVAVAQEVFRRQRAQGDDAAGAARAIER